MRYDKDPKGFWKPLGSLLFCWDDQDGKMEKVSGGGAHLEGFHQLGVAFEGDAGDDAEVGQLVG